MCGAAAEEALKIYQSPYDDRTFHFRENLKLHNRVKRFEEAEEMQVLKRLNINNPNFTAEDLDLEVKKKQTVYRFLKKPEKTLEDELEELRNERRKQRMLNAVANLNGGTKEGTPIKQKNIGEAEQANIEKDKNNMLDEGSSTMWKPTLRWPENYDDLPPIERTKPTKKPAYYGWTHSNGADSWYLESNTPGSHEQYNCFYKNLYGKKATCPRLWDTVFPETERHVTTRKSA